VRSPQQHGNVIAFLVCDGQVGNLITVEIADRDRPRPVTGEIVLVLLERPVPDARQHRNVVAGQFRCHEIQSAIEIEVTDRQRPGAGVDPVDHGWLESPITSVQQYRYIVGASILVTPQSKIRCSVPIEVRNHKTRGLIAHGIEHRRSKRAIPISKEHGGPICIRDSRSEIRSLIPIEIADGNCLRH